MKFHNFHYNNHQDVAHVLAVALLIWFNQNGTRLSPPAFKWEMKNCKDPSDNNIQTLYTVVVTSTWIGIDTLANCNKVEHDKIWKYNEVLMFLGVTC